MSKNDRTISERLEDIQKLILENKKLQNEFPKQKRSLQLNLIGLKNLKEEISSSES
jgi:hypothetical protein